MAERMTEIPSATYRLQLNRNFTFRDAAAIVPYLSALGISHCYLSPYLRARPESSHGYDVIDHNALNPEIGTPEEYEHLINELHRHGMGQIADIVPNHMGVMGSDNSWWLDVLENGEASDFAEFFDIDWDPIKDELQGKVLIPILADQYGNELETGKLKLVFDHERGEFGIFYFQHRFPVDPAEYPRILGPHSEKQEKFDPNHEGFLELQSISTAFGHLPGRRGLSVEQRAERNREKEVQKRRLAAVFTRSPEIQEFITRNLELYNGEVEDPRSFDLLHELIKTQAYRLAQWRVAADDINYRRFFDINDLAALRQENEVVFQNTHRFTLALVAQGKVDGLRIDHPDGLYDPAAYFRELHDQFTIALADQNQKFYIVAEKILTGREKLREGLPVNGTTGYEFSNLVNGLFVAQNAAERMDRTYRSFSGTLPDFADLVYSCKKLILKVGLASELNVLANLLTRIALANRHTCDFTLNSFRSALAEIISCFPVYRTYITREDVSTEDRRYVQQAVAAGKKRSNAADLSVFDFIQRVLLQEFNGSEPEFYKRAICRFAMKFQQVTAAVMAKGLEDTAFYRYHRLTSLNDVGGNPGKFGTTVEEFHRANLERARLWPHSMLSSSTHDSKRSEDVRARINALSEMPPSWRLHLNRWSDWNRSKKSRIEGGMAPSRNDEYLLYQTLVGMWPAEPLDDAGWIKFCERIEQYMLKAAREAKEHTSWANTNQAYETALSSFVTGILDRSCRNLFLSDFSNFHRQVARIGAFNSLSQCLLKMTSPGVPDIYQGTELPDFSLVDPDNRRPVDYALRQELLKGLQSRDQGPDSLTAIRALIRSPESPALKLFLSWKILSLRRANRGLFQYGSYVPLNVTGSNARHVVAFARKHEERSLVIAVPRLCESLLGDGRETLCEEQLWKDTSVELTDSTVRCFHDLFTGACVTVEGGAASRRIPLSGVLQSFPVVVLLSEAFSKPTRE